MEPQSPSKSETSSSTGNCDFDSPIKIENCSLGNGDSSSSPIKNDDISMGNGESNSPKRPRAEESNSSPKRRIIEELGLWLEDLFVKKPESTLTTCKLRFDVNLDNFYQTNSDLVANMPKELLIENVQKLAYQKLFLEQGMVVCDDVSKDILEKMQIVTFNNGEVHFLEGYDQYFATLFFTNNISEQSQDVLSENIFKPEYSAVKFFINEIAEQNKTGPLYEMWDTILYSRVFPSAPSDQSIAPGPDQAIRSAVFKVTSAKPECLFERVKEYLDLAKKHNRLQFEVYEAILLSLMNKLIIADLSSTSQESSYEKLLRYNAYYKSLLLKTVYFEDKSFSSAEKIIISNMKDLIAKVKLTIDGIYQCGMDRHWLERDGLYLASSIKTLTKFMVSQYMHVFDKLPYGGGYKLIYAERIYTYFIKPLLNSIEDEGPPEIDLSDFLTLFVSVTQYMFETQQRGISHDNHYSKKELLLTKNEWKGLRMWMENTEEISNLVTAVFDKYKLKRPESIRECFLS